MDARAEPVTAPLSMRELTPDRGGLSLLVRSVSAVDLGAASAFASTQTPPPSAGRASFAGKRSLREALCARATGQPA
jgi:hypothetical protein